jgi:ATP-dependent Lhr-like helicase
MTSEEAAISVHHEGNGAAAEHLLKELVGSNRATRFRFEQETFWAAAERLHFLQTIYPQFALEPELVAPESARRQTWERADAIRELLRGRMEVAGPITAAELIDILRLSRSEIDAALLALEAEGFVLRGKFHPDAIEQEWCDRRLLARIHRLTIDRLRAEIQPVSPQDFYRFLFAWQRVGPEHRVEGLEGLQSVLEQLDGCELQLAAWESTVLAARVDEYDPEWLDRLCFSGRVGWGRLSSPQSQNGRVFAPLRTSPIALYQRENLQDWLQLAQGNSKMELAVVPQTVFDALAQGGALFFTEIVRQTGLLPSQIEEALSQLAAIGFVTSDSFDGLRALLVPSDKRPTLGRNEGRRRRKTNLASIEFAGRWSLLRTQTAPQNLASGALALQPRTMPQTYRAGAPPANRFIPDTIQSSAKPSDALENLRGSAVEKFARVLLRRYGVVFRRLLERENLAASWYELGRIYRRLEARGEIRGGYFVGGVSGEQFALPEAIGLLRSIRKASPHQSAGDLVTLSAADPLNLQGILIPGPRISAIATNRILFRDGLPLAALEGGEIRKFAMANPSSRGLADDSVSDSQIETALKVGKLRPSLRPYYK